MYLSLVITDGLVLGLDGSVIVTSDRRKTVSDYSSLCGVAVLEFSKASRA
jgi:hypothetical protein